jgi:hypothetical protein
MCTLELRNKTSPLPLHGCAPPPSSLQLLWRTFCLKATPTTLMENVRFKLQAHTSHAVFYAPSSGTFKIYVGRVHDCFCIPPPNYKVSSFPIYYCTHSPYLCLKKPYDRNKAWCSWREFPKARPCTFMVSLLLLPSAYRAWTCSEFSQKEKCSIELKLHGSSSLRLRSKSPPSRVMRLANREITCHREGYLGCGYINCPSTSCLLFLLAITLDFLFIPKHE